MNFFPLLGAQYPSEDYGPVDLSENNLAGKNVNSDFTLRKFLDNTIEDQTCKILYGGYLEKRNLYKSDLFDEEGEEKRNIHLGIDLWAPEGSPIFAPIDGHIHSYAYNGEKLDYGYTLILIHKIRGKIVYSLYGHLSGSMMQAWKERAFIPKGTIIGYVGGKDENGGWLPHLHFQLIRDMEGRKGDYPGVCSAANIVYYSSNCPDPSSFMSFGVI